MPTLGKQLTQWDTADIIQAQVEFLKTTGDYPDKTDAELYRFAAEDPDLFAREWNDLCAYLTELMQRNPHNDWRTEVHHFGWRSLNGYKIFSATTGKDLLRQVLPDTDCTFRVYRYGKGLAINNAHHDSPYWAEWYYILPYKETMASAA